MKPTQPILWLSALVVLLAIIASGAGLFWHGEGQPYDFTTLRGHTVQIYGQGLYQYDTYFKAPILRGADAVTLFLAVPLLIVAMRLTARGMLRGRLFLAAMLSYFLYNAISLALGVYFNALVLVYMLYFSASLFAFILAVASIDTQDLAARLAPNVPRRGMAIWTFVAGLTVFVWLPDMITALLQNKAPEGLAHYTTEITYLLDPGIITPTAFLACYLLIKRMPMGYVLAAILLVLNALVGVMVISQTIFQTIAAITLTPGQMIGFVGSFVVMGTIAIFLAARLFGGIREDRPAAAGKAARKVARRGAG